MVSELLTSTFLSNWLAQAPPGTAQPRYDGDEDLELLLSSLTTAGREAWPDFVLEDLVFVAHLARHAPGGDLERWLRSLCIEDLYLACACAQGLPGALQVFEERYLAMLSGVLGSRDANAALVEDACQNVREKLLVAVAGAPPRIAAYSGRGSLQGFVRTAAVRGVIDLQRQKSGAPLDGDEDAALEALSAGQEPELEYIRGRYRQDFKQAFQDALAKLPLEQRSALRLHYLNGLNIDRLGVMLQVHRSTVNRWLVDARAKILTEMRRLLRERLSLSPGDFDSLAALVRSSLDLSISRVLKEGDGEQGQGD